jgi:hypothetical protein
MKLDLDLIRKIVLAVEDTDGGRAPTLSFEGFSPSQVGYHAHLLVDAGIARGVDVTHLGSEAPAALITDLTWAGHGFAALARDDDRWRRAMRAINSKGGGFTFEGLKQLLSAPEEQPAESSSQRGFQFEREVAAIYRALGARVEQDVVVAGNQVDVVVEEETASGSRIKTVIECKNFSRPAGIEVVNQFAPLFGLFKGRGLADKGTIVASHGFTKQAREAAKDMGVELLEFADLQHRVQGRASDLKAAEEEVDQARITQAATGKKEPPRIFVVMPFADEFVDVYVLGIRDVAEKLGFAVQRADDIEHNSNILEVIQRQIRQCDVVIADMTGRNANVFYEIGYALALERQTILICRKGEVIPFDLQAMNHISYSNIVDLKERLERRLKATPHK